MGYGGATSGTAGTLDLGGGNTFAAVDVTETGGIDYTGGTGLPFTDQPPYHHAWWTYTHSGPDAQVVVDPTPSTFVGSSVLIWVAVVKDGVLITSGAPDFPPTFAALTGDAFHVVAGTFEPDAGSAVATYALTASARAYVYSEWFELEDDPEQNLFITGGDNAVELVAQNPNPGYAAVSPAWAANVVRTVQGRRGEYEVQEWAGTAWPAAWLACALPHANVGNVGSQTNQAGACVDVPLGGTADPGSATENAAVRLHKEVTGGLASNSTGASISGPAYALFHKPVGDSLPWWETLWGDALLPLDPAYHGLSEEAELIPEADSPTLLGIDVADGNPDDVNLLFEKLWVNNEPAGPDWDINGSSHSTPWNIGPIGIPPSVLPPRYTQFTYSADDELLDPDVDRWNPLPDVVDWDDFVSDWELDEDEDVPTACDDVLVCWPSAYPTDTPDNVVYEEARLAQPALRYRLAVGGRLRFRYIPDATASPAPRRVLGRPHPARVWGDNTVQNGRRVIGGIL
jgi:hypothetical protein